MPNWVECELTVKGKPDVVLRFLEGLKKVADEQGEPPDRVQILQAYVPMPDAIRNTTAGSEEMGYKILYTDEWRELAKYPWLGTSDREATWAAFVKARINEKTTEADLRAIADRLKLNHDTYGSATWWDWRHRHWGSKWGDCRSHIVSHDAAAGVVRIDFESPWSPPMAGLEQVSALFPDLEFTLEYWEGGMGFQGHAVWIDGDLAEDESCEYSGPRGG